MRKQLVGDLDFLHSNIGVIEGTVGLLLIWLALALIERRGRSLGQLIAKSIRQPLLLGLSASLYLGWLGQQIAKNRHLVGRQQCAETICRHHGDRGHVGDPSPRPCPDGNPAL